MKCDQTIKHFVILYHCDDKLLKFGKINFLGPIEKKEINFAYLLKPKCLDYVRHVKRFNFSFLWHDVIDKAWSLSLIRVAAIFSK